MTLRMVLEFVAVAFAMLVAFVVGLAVLGLGMGLAARLLTWAAGGCP